MSEQTTTFDKVVESYFPKLDLFTTAITRAHGKNHPEAFEVRELFEQMNEKVKEASTDKLNLDEELIQLRHVTDHYKVPKDVCETYASTYHMLSEIDKSYHL